MSVLLVRRHCIFHTLHLRRNKTKANFVYLCDMNICSFVLANPFYFDLKSRLACDTIIIILTNIACTIMFWAFVETTLIGALAENRTCRAQSKSISAHICNAIYALVSLLMGVPYHLDLYLFVCLEFEMQNAFCAKLGIRTIFATFQTCTSWGRACMHACKTLTRMCKMTYRAWSLRCVCVVCLHLCSMSWACVVHASIAWIQRVVRRFFFVNVYVCMLRMLLSLLLLFGCWCCVVVALL